MLRTCSPPMRPISGAEGRNAGTERRHRLTIGHARAERHHLAGLADVLQGGEMADEYDRPDLAHEFGDPQADIGRAGDERGRRLLFEDRRQDRRRRPAPSSALCPCPQPRGCHRPWPGASPRPPRARRSARRAPARHSPTGSALPERSIDSRCSGRDCPAATARSRFRLHPAGAATAHRATSRCRACRSRIASHAYRQAPVERDAGGRRAASGARPSPRGRHRASRGSGYRR